MAKERLKSPSRRRKSDRISQHLRATGDSSNLMIEVTTLKVHASSIGQPPARAPPPAGWTDRQTDWQTSGKACQIPALRLRVLGSWPPGSQACACHRAAVRAMAPPGRSGQLTACLWMSRASGENTIVSSKWPLQVHASSSRGPTATGSESSSGRGR